MDEELPLFPPRAARRHDVLCIGTALVDLLSHAPLETVAALGLNAGTMTLIEGAQAEAIGAGLDVERAISGGTVANTAVGIAALGGSPAYLGAVADDALGERFAADLEESKVTAVLEHLSGSATGACYVIVTPDSQRTMATSLGVSGRLSGRFVAESTLIPNSEIVYFDGYILDFPDAQGITAALFGQAATSETLVAFGLADPFAVGRHHETMVELIDRVDLLFGNEEEAMALSGASDLDGVLTYLAHDRRVSVVTRGPLGAVIVTPAGNVAIDAVAVAEVRDVTGAGDMFAAGVLYGAVHGGGARRAGAIGAHLAAEAISHLGARPEADLAALVAAAGLA